jgi:choline dehydrogenase-like flavoprotein
MTDGTRGTWGCAINPETAWEQRWRAYPPAPRPSRVVVVGGGPAGLEAARVAARRGHRVVLFERQDRVGGQLNLWAALPDREIFATTPEWYERRLRRHGVDVRLNTEATADLILAEEPGAILIGTGSRYIRTGETGYFKRPVPGWDQDFVVTPEQVFSIGDALSPPRADRRHPGRPPVRADRRRAGRTAHVHRPVLRARGLLDVPAAGLGPARRVGG